jgi:hypothetical protein
MPFRSDAAPPPTALYAPADPLERYKELYAALAVPASWLSDKVPLRLASVCLLTTPGDATLLAATLRRRDADLRVRLGWLTSVAPAVRLLLSAQMVKYGDDPDAFVDEVERVREMFRAVELRRGSVYEALAVLVLRRVNAGGPISLAQVERLRDIYAAMKRHHWFLTGPEDFPACAMLVGRPEDPTTIGDGTDAIYRALLERADLWRGDSLQTAANLLYLAGVEPATIAERYALILAGFREAGTRIGQAQYDELAILCFLAWPVERIVSVVAGFRERLRERNSTLGKTEALNLAASLAFVHIAGQDGALGPIADAKLLLDMQAIVTARAASGA